MADRLKGKNAVVTGGAGGIGRSLCLALAAEGANVVVNDIGAALDGSGTSREPADKLVSQIVENGGNAIGNYDSVSDFASAESLIQSCVAKFGSIDILVNAHGNMRDNMVWSMSEQEWDSVINVHLKGTFNTCRHACARMMEQRHGRIINFTSDAWRGTACRANYSAAKGGIVSFTQSTAKEMERYGVTANCISPVALTRMTRSREANATRKKRLELGFITRQQYDNAVNIGGPEFVAPIVVFLATDAATNINGRVFHIEKGRVGIYSEPVEVKMIFNEGQIWDVDDLISKVPGTLLI